MLCLIVFILVNLNARSTSGFFQRSVIFIQNAEFFENQVINFLYIALDKIPPFVWIIILVAFLGWVSIGGIIWYFLVKNKKKTEPWLTLPRFVDASNPLMFSWGFI